MYRWLRRNGKSPDSLVKGENLDTVPVVPSKLSGLTARMAFGRPWLETRARMRCVFRLNKPSDFLPLSEIKEIIYHNKHFHFTTNV